jgi:hypothetical protein
MSMRSGEPGEERRYELEIGAPPGAAAIGHFETRGVAGDSGRQGPLTRGYPSERKAVVIMTGHTRGPRSAAAP